jgi:hypothetical protein
MCVLQAEDTFLLLVCEEWCRLQNNFFGFCFFQHFILHNFMSYITTDGLDPWVQAVLLKLCSLYGACSLERHLATLYQGMYPAAF